MKQYKRFIAVMSAVTVCTVGFTGFDSIAAPPGGAGGGNREH